jgi:hypothetical protein
MAARAARRCGGRVAAAVALLVGAGAAGACGTTGAVHEAGGSRVAAMMNSDAHRSMDVIADGVERRATIGEYCLADPTASAGPTTGSRCVDVAYDPTPSKATIPVTAGGTVVVHPGVAASGVWVSLHRPSRAGTSDVELASRRARRRDANGRWWTVSTPATGPATILRVYAEFTDGGSAEFFLAIRTARRAG